MSKLVGSVVLITGGASGIGRLMGDMCLQDGASSLVIWDDNKEKLDATTREIRALHFIVHPYLVDVSDPDRVRAAAIRVKEEVGSVDVLINNAGIITGNRNFAEHSHSEIDQTIAVNVRSHMHVTLEFLPDMIARGRGHILNVSSAAGMIANPRMSVYCASKWAISGWSDSLRLELAMGKTGVHVTTLEPSYIATGMFAGVRISRLIPVLKPEVVAAQAVRAIKFNRSRVRAPFMIRLLPLLKGILPMVLFDLIAGSWLGVYKSMDTFSGHSFSQRSS